MLRWLHSLYLKKSPLLGPLWEETVILAAGLGHAARQWVGPSWFKQNPGICQKQTTKQCDSTWRCTGTDGFEMCSHLWRLAPGTRHSAVHCSHNRILLYWKRTEPPPTVPQKSLMYLGEAPGKSSWSIIFISGGICGAWERQAGRTISKMYYIIVTLAVCTGSMSLPFSNSTAPLFVLPHPKLQGQCSHKWQQGLILLKTDLGKGNHLFSLLKDITVKQSWDAELQFRSARSLAVISQNWR